MEGSRCGLPKVPPACMRVSAQLSTARSRSLGCELVRRASAAYHLCDALGLVSGVLSSPALACPQAAQKAGYMLLFGYPDHCALLVTDMQYPRLGLIRIESFDHFLADAYEQMRDETGPRQAPKRESVWGQVSGSVLCEHTLAGRRANRRFRSRRFPRRRRSASRRKQVDETSRELRLPSLLDEASDANACRAGS